MMKYIKYTDNYSRFMCTVMSALLKHLMRPLVTLENSVICKGGFHYNETMAL